MAVPKRPAVFPGVLVLEFDMETLLQFKEVDAESIWMSIHTDTGLCVSYTIIVIYVVAVIYTCQLIHFPG